MKIEIKDSRIVNSRELAIYIDECFNSVELSELLNELSALISDGTVDLQDARLLLNIVNQRLRIINNNSKLFSEKNALDGGKKMVILPTSVSNKAGMISMIFLIFNISITVVMFTILAIAKIRG